MIYSRKRLCVTDRPTNQQTDQPTNQWTDKVGYHVKYLFNFTTDFGEYIRPECIGKENAHYMMMNISVAFFDAIKQNL